MNFEQEFIIHPVGQGLFYSGYIRQLEDIKFRMVFDCGSRTAKAGQEEVEIYRTPEFLKERIIDLLVISHFDQDHVNHIGRLVAGNVKIRRLVLPFVNFVERLFLVFKLIESNDGFPDDEDFLVKFILNPLDALQDNLDLDSEVILIDGGSDIINPPENEFPSEESVSSNEGNRFTFDFEESNKEIINDNEEEFFLAKKGTIYKVNHANKAKLKSNNSSYLMEFLFYKRDVDSKTGSFFKKIEELFLIEYNLDKEDTKKFQSQLFEVIKQIKSATKISSLFLKAKKELTLSSIDDELEIQNMNTTSLCLMHRNLDGFSSLCSKEVTSLSDIHYFSSNQIHKIQKFFSTPTCRIEFPFCDFYHYELRRFGYRWHCFPNVLLTSDTFLKTTTQITEFTDHFKHYWLDFWLFQIPHHGSENNSDRKLFSFVPSWSFNFINYGVTSKHHPSLSVMNDLITSGKSTKLISVNEYNGLRFIFSF